MANDATGQKRAALVFNPVKANPETLPAYVTHIAVQSGWAEPLILETTPEDIGDGVTRQALDEGVDVVLVAGGDGTVRAASEAIAGSGVPLAIIPSGTGNLLARNLRLPLDKKDPMVAAAFDGDVRDIDIGWATLTDADGAETEHAFVVMGGMGLDADMIANTSGELKKRVGWVAYVGGATRSLLRAKPFPVLYQVTGRRLHRANVHSMLFANCGSLPGGLELIPEASVDDGQLDIVVVQPKGPLGWLLVWRRVAWDNSLLRRFRRGRDTMRLRTTDNAIAFAKGTGFEVAADEPRNVQLDGDEFGSARKIVCRVDPGALKIAVPRGHTFSE